MNVGERMGLMTLLPSVHPQDAAGGALAGTYICLKNHQRVTVVVSMGVHGTGPVTIELLQAMNVAAAGVKALNFDAVWRLGGIVRHGPTTLGAFQVNEIVTGVGSGATGIIHEIHNGHMVIYSIVGTFAVGDVLTGTTSAATATATTAMLEYGLNCRVAMTAANTVALAIPDETYEIEIEGSDLDINNGFDCMVAGVSASGGVDIVGVNYLLSKLRYKEEPQKSAFQD